jgi:hypothetical protein
MTTRCFGLVARRERWGLTWRGRLTVAIVTLTFIVIVLRTIQPFLAITERTPASVLVVEGWIPASTMDQAAREFKTGGYQRLILLRPILADPDKYISGRFNGDYMANMLFAYGVPQERETTLYPLVAEKDRTFHSALDAKKWLLDHGMPVESLDVVTIGPHARRSRLMYEKAFGGGARIGIVALRDSSYDPTHWWRTSEGVREVVGETIAYIYARLLFHPYAPDSDQ